MHSGLARIAVPVTLLSARRRVWIRTSLVIVLAGGCGSDLPDPSVRVSGPVAPTLPPTPTPASSGLLIILPDGEFGDTLQIAPGQALGLSAFYQDSLGLKVRSNDVTWSSGDASTVTISQSGVATAVTPGVARITARLLQFSATRTIRVAPTSGTATIRMISVVDAAVTMAPGVGAPATLVYGALSERVIPAGTFQLSFDGVPPITSFYNLAFYGLQTFLGFLPAGAHESFVAVSNEWCADPMCSGATIAWLHDRAEAVPADSAPVRVMLAAQQTYVDSYNVFLTKPGERASVVTLVGCYLDWPFAFTEYADRGPGDVDIVLLKNKFSIDPSAPEVARFHVTATAGHASTFIISGGSRATLKILSVVDR